jgi:hypothetical protein
MLWATACRQRAALAGASFTGSVNDQDFFPILRLIDRYGVAVPSERLRSIP